MSEAGSQAERWDGTNDAGAKALGPGVHARPGDADRLRELAVLTANARADFGIACFWNTPVPADPVEDARLVAGRLRKYGGRRGWATATGIDRALREMAGASDGIDRIPARDSASSRGEPITE